MFSPTDTLNYSFEQVVTSRIYFIWDGINSGSDNLLNDLYDESVLVDTSFHQHQSYFNFALVSTCTCISETKWLYKICRWTYLHWAVWDEIEMYTVFSQWDLPWIVRAHLYGQQQKGPVFNHEFFTYFINCTFADFFFFLPRKTGCPLHIFFFTSDWMFWDF